MCQVLANALIVSSASHSSVRIGNDLACLSQAA